MPTACHVAPVRTSHLQPCACVHFQQGHHTHCKPVTSRQHVSRGNGGICSRHTRARPQIRRIHRHSTLITTHATACCCVYPSIHLACRTQKFKYLDVELIDQPTCSLFKVLATVKPFISKGIKDGAVLVHWYTHPTFPPSPGVLSPTGQSLTAPHPALLFSAAGRSRAPAITMGFMISAMGRSYAEARATVDKVRVLALNAGSCVGVLQRIQLLPAPLTH